MTLRKRILAITDALLISTWLVWVTCAISIAAVPGHFIPLPTRPVLLAPPACDLGEIGKTITVDGWNFYVAKQGVVCASPLGSQILERDSSWEVQ